MHIHKLSKSYKDKTVVQHASISLQEGSCLGLLGANGAGKSTFIKMILGLSMPDIPPEEPINHDAIAYLPELPYLPQNLTARQIVHHSANIHGIAEKQVNNTLKLVNLNAQYWDAPIRQFSKGMQQRTAIAFALVSNAKWLILDEPMSGLDALGRREILDIILRLKKQGTGILMCSHSVPDLVRVCDQIAIMVAGEIHETRTIHEHSLQEAEKLEQTLAEMNKMVEHHD